MAGIGSGYQNGKRNQQQPQQHSLWQNAIRKNRQFNKQK